ncbi:MAG: histidine phosphatase family protein [Patescibacteria group bacterium]|nr:histidine phosphatase family protein [Patescibacteria group bacterium]
MGNCIIYLVRHGESEYNRDNIVSGQVDPALTEKGKKQAAAAKDKLAHISFDIAYSSDLERAVDTGEIIYGKPIPQENMWEILRERSYGEYDGLPGHHLEKLYEDNYAEIAALSKDERWRFKHVPEMESNHEIATRFISALHEIAEANDGKTVLVAAHGGIIRTTLIDLGYATEEELPSRSLENASYAELIYKDGEFEIGTTSGVNKR